MSERHHDTWRMVTEAALDYADADSEDDGSDMNRASNRMRKAIETYSRARGWHPRDECRPAVAIRRARRRGDAVRRGWVQMAFKWEVA